MSRHFYRLTFYRNGRPYLHAIYENKLNARKAYLKLRTNKKSDSKHLDEVFWDSCIGRWQYVQTLNHTDGNSRDSDRF